jgi:hypothetical protein
LIEDKDALEDFLLFWNFILKQGISIGAYKVGTNKTVSELVAVNILCFMTVNLEKDIENIMVINSFIHINLTLFS